MVEIGDREMGDERVRSGTVLTLPPPPRYRLHAISRTSPRAPRFWFGGITFVELSNGFGSMGHGGSGFPTVFGDVETSPVNQVLQLTM